VQIALGTPRRAARACRRAAACRDHACAAARRAELFAARDGLDRRRARLVPGSASWPVAAASWPSILKIIPAALINAPVLIFGLRLLKQRPGLDDRRWFALALAGWLALQLIALSYGRPGGTPESRYSDIFIIGVVLNAAAWLHLLRTAPQTPLAAVASVWLFAVMLGAGQKATDNVIDGISARVRTGQIQTENVKNFISTGDFAHLAGKPHLHIPFPSAERLAELLSDPKLRAILPAALTGAPEGRAKTVDPAALARCCCRSGLRC
jgi:hypothetical protein